MNLVLPHPCRRTALVQGRVRTELCRVAEWLAAHGVIPRQPSDAGRWLGWDGWVSLPTEEHPPRRGAAKPPRR